MKDQPEQDEDRRRRWRLVLGEPAQEPLDPQLGEAELDMDAALAALRLIVARAK